MKAEFKAAAALAVCITPSAAINIWPRLAAVVEGTGSFDHTTAALITFQAAAVAVMAWCPIAIARCGSWQMRTAGAVLFVVLAAVNFSNALEVASHGRDEKAAAARGTIADAAAAQRDIAALQASRDKLPAFVPATAATAAAARQAVAAAEKSRQDECAQRGPRCRDREADEKRTRAELVEIEARRALTDRADRIEAEIASAKARAGQAGAAPRHEDGAAFRIAQMLGTTEAAVLDWWPILQALAVELLAALGPVVLLGGQTAAPARDSDNITIAPKRQEPRTAPKAAVPAVVAATPVRRVAGVAEVVGIDEWLRDRTAKRAGQDLKSGDAFADYEAYARLRGEQALNLTAFGLALKAAGVEKYTTPSKRTYYRGMVLCARPKLVAAG